MLLKTFKYEIFLFLNLGFTCTSGKYEPTWESLDTRPLPSWFDEDKLGVGIYWGVYTVPGFSGQFFKYYLNLKHADVVAFMKDNYRPGFQYDDFASELNGEFFDADRWVSMFQKAGMKFVVLYTKHWDGYTLFPSKRVPGWNSVDMGPHTDVAKELANATSKYGLKFGISYTFGYYQAPDHVISDLKQQADDYKPSIILPTWASDRSDSYWTSKEFLAYLYNDSPVKDYVVVRDKWGDGSSCSHGCICYDDCQGKTKKKWLDVIYLGGDENSSSYRRNMKLKDVKTIEELLARIVDMVSDGGNVLIDFGPNKDGMIDPIFEERLLQIGEWLRINGKAIYHSSPWTIRKESDAQIYYTCHRKQKDKTSEIDELYVVFLKWPEDNILILKNVFEHLKSTKMAPVALLGNENHSLKWKKQSGIVRITLPEQHLAKSQWAWVVQFKPRTNSFRKSETLNYYFNIKTKKNLKTN